MFVCFPLKKRLQKPKVTPHFTSEEHVSCTETLMLVSLPWLQTGSDFFSILTPDVHQSPQRFYIESRQIVQTNYKSPVYEALNTARGRTLTHCQTVFYENYLFWPNTYM